MTVEKRTIRELFTNNLYKGKFKNYTIPEYQRPYAWDEDRCTILWDDIIDFHNEMGADDEYYLGSLVVYKDTDNATYQVIDGQQRLTTFTLMLKAIYDVIKDGKKLETKKLIEDIGTCLWKTDPKSGEKSNDIHIISKAIEDANNMLKEILADNYNNSNLYSENYNSFKSKFDDYIDKNIDTWADLCLNILDKLVVLFVECETEDAALRIFSTLNDRGLQLADSDIFKVKLYQQCKNYKEQKDFMEDWNELSNICKSISKHITKDNSIDYIFRCYSHILRAKENDYSSEIALRQFYSGKESKGRGGKKYDLRVQFDIMENLIYIANVLDYIYDSSNKNKDADIKFEISLGARKYIHCLLQLSNEYWKYALIIFLFNNKKDTKYINENLELFTEKLLAFMIKELIIRGGSNTKMQLLKMYCDIKEKKCIEEIFKNYQYSDRKILDSMIKEIKNAQMTPLLLLHSYLHKKQITLIKENFQIEHILPKKYKAAYYNLTDEEAKEYIQKLGNKIVIDKKINIKAGNNWSAAKKEEYRKSDIAEVKDLSLYEKDDWELSDIDKRINVINKNIINFILKNMKYNELEKNENKLRLKNPPLYNKVRRK